MAHVLSANEFYDYDAVAPLREALLELQKIPIIINEGVDFVLDKISEDQHISHQLYVLEKYDSIDTINLNENFLLANGYNPVSLIESGVYDTAVKTMDAINENILSTLKAGLNAVTEDGSPLGILHFILDILGLVPDKWLAFVGLPPAISTTANLLNAVIYAIREKWLFMILNIVACFDLTGVIAAPFKILVKPFAKVASKFTTKLFVRGAGKSAATVFTKEAAASPKLITSMGQMLASVGKWLAKSGLYILKSIIPAIIKLVDKVTFGAFKLEKIIPKMTKTMDDWIAKLSIFSKEADEASKILLNPKLAKETEKTLAKSVKGVEKAAVDTAHAGGLAARTPKQLLPGAEAAVRTGANTQIMKDLVKLGGFSTETVAQSAAKFAKAFPNGASKAVQQNFILNDATATLVANILNKKVGLIAITKNPKIMKQLASKTWKGSDKLLATAIKSGNPKAVSKLMNKMLNDPAFFKIVSKNSPDVAKTIALFKNAPEVLVNGSKAFAEFGAKRAFKLAHVSKTVSNFSVFLVKILLKGTECGRYVSDLQTDQEKAEFTSPTTVSGAIGAATSGVKSEIPTSTAVTEQDIDPIKSAQTDKAQLLNKSNPNSYVEVVGSTTQSSAPISTPTVDELSQLKTTNPQGYSDYVKVDTEADAAANDLIEKTSPKNPCESTVEINKYKAGAIIDTNNKAWKQGQVVVNLDSPEKFKEANTDNYTKGILDLLKQDTNIDAQHPLANQSPIIKAYFSDVVNYNGEIDPVTGSDSRLDKMLDEMVKNGEITEDKKIAMRARILKSWETDTVPPEVINVGVGTPSANESLFKIGKLLTIR